MLKPKTLKGIGLFQLEVLHVFGKIKVEQKVTKS